MIAAQFSRAALLRRGAAGAAVGAAALGIPGIARADLGISHGSEQIGEIYELQASFHSAKSHQDIDLMASLWAEDATFTNFGTPIYGRDAITEFFLTTGSWKHRRMSLVPSFKDQVDVHGDSAFLYFECHDVSLGDAGDAPYGTIVTHLFNAGTILNIAGSWLFYDMHGAGITLDVNRIFYP
jgi:ketosteroid isomerase-like protein